MVVSFPRRRSAPSGRKETHCGARFGIDHSFFVRLFYDGYRYRVGFSLGLERGPGGRLPRLFQLVLAGHLCCLTGFELSRLWSFFPSDFYPATVIVVVLAFFFALLSSTLRPAQGMVFGNALVAWGATVLYPLLLNRHFTSWVYLLLALVLSFLSLRGRGLGYGLLTSTLLFALYRFTALNESLIGLFLVVLSLLELRAKCHEISTQALLQEVVLQYEDTVPRAEISWRGFARLYAASARGEGERFSGKVLQDTLKVVHCCGGVLESGSEHRGVYTFPNSQAREECRVALAEYGERLAEVLASVEAPRVSLIFKDL